MASLTHQIPSEFSDEDKWFKFFTKKTLFFIAPGVIFTILLFKWLNLYGQGLTGAIIGIVVTCLLAFISAFPKPEEEYLRGGGLTLDIILLRIFIRKSEKVVYTKGYSYKETEGEV